MQRGDIASSDITVEIANDEAAINFLHSLRLYVAQRFHRSFAKTKRAYLRGLCGCILSLSLSLSPFLTVNSAHRRDIIFPLARGTRYLASWLRARVAVTLSLFLQLPPRNMGSDSLSLSLSFSAFRNGVRIRTESGGRSSNRAQTLVRFALSWIA